MKLHEQVKAQKEVITTYEEGLLSIVRYLNLPKFYEDRSVNKDDILLRIEEIRDLVVCLEK